MARLPLLYAFLSKWGELREQARRAGAAWPIRGSREAAAEPFRQTARAHGVKHLHEPGCDHQGCADFYESARSR